MPHASVFSLFACVTGVNDRSEKRDGKSCIAFYAQTDLYQN